MQLSILITAIWSSQLFVAHASISGIDHKFYCPKISVADVCQLESRFGIFYDYSGCATVSEIEYQYCKGSCGNGSVKPRLYRPGADEDEKKVWNTHRCCLPHVDPDRFKEVNITCNGGNTTVGYLSVISFCRCDWCCDSRYPDRFKEVNITCNGGNTTVGYLSVISFCRCDWCCDSRSYKV